MPGDVRLEHIEQRSAVTSMHTTSWSPAVKGALAGVWSRVRLQTHDSEEVSEVVVGGVRQAGKVVDGDHPGRQVPVVARKARQRLGC